jgi:phosphoribosylformylglycinamidine cyclo-ligase
VGGFGALYRLGDYRDPVLVSGTDGVGTKLHIARDFGSLEGIGIDCVAMCVNDILCHGAAPLFFLDYLAYAGLDAENASRIIGGVAEGCRRAGCALVGGESAQMPGTYGPGDFDIAGFAVGVVERDAMLTGDRIEPGDALIGLASSGIHSNGFSLVRAVLRERGIDLHSEFSGRPLWRTLLEPTAIYVKSVLPLVEAGIVRGMAHITGGGLYENVPRMFAGSSGHEDSLAARIHKNRLRVPPILDFLQSLGIEEEEMFRTYNMGIGMVLAVAAGDADRAVSMLESAGTPAWNIGEVEAGGKPACEGGVCID